MLDNQLTYNVIGCAMEVHRELGPGLLESAYEECLFFVLHQKGMVVQRQVPIPLNFRGVKLDCGYRADLIVERKLILEIKAVELIKDIHVAQVLPYLKISKLNTGLLINFNTPVLKNGIIRLVN